MTTAIVEAPKKLNKYQQIWIKILGAGECSVKCDRIDTNTIINGVKKLRQKESEKVKGKLLRTTLTDEGIKFELIPDTTISLRNI